MFDVSVKFPERHFINKSCTVLCAQKIYIFMFIKTQFTQHSSIFVYHTQAKKIGLKIEYCNVLILPWNVQLFFFNYSNEIEFQGVHALGS